MERYRRALGEALRTLRRHPLLGAAVVLTLGLGVGVNTLLFSVVHAVLLRPPPFRDPSRLFVVWEQDPARDAHLHEVSFPDFQDWRSQTRCFADLAAIGSIDWSFRLSQAGEKIPLSYRAVSASFFETLGVRPLLGRGFRPEDDEPGAERVVVLSHRTWRDRFAADPALIGRPITLDDQSFSVVGVMPPEVRFPPQAELWTPVGRGLADVARRNALSLEQQRGLGVLFVVARLQQGVTPAAAKAELDSVIRGLHAVHRKAGRQQAAAFTALADHVLGNTRSVLLALWGSVAALLLLALLNVATLQLALFAARQRETAIRLSLGAPARTIVARALLEGGLLGLAGAAAGLALAAAALRTLLASGFELPRLEEARLDAGGAWFAACLSLVTACLATLLPALRLRSIDVSAALRGAPQTVPALRRYGGPFRALVASQVALAQLLLIGAGLSVRSLWNATQLDLGYRPRSVLVLRVGLPEDGPRNAQARRSLTREILQRLRGLAGVAAVGAGSPASRPFQHGAIGDDWSYVLEGQPPEPASFEKNPRANGIVVTPGYFAAMGIELLAGRDFGDRDTEGQPLVVVVGRGLARRAWPGQQAIGRRLWTGTRDAQGRPVWHTVIGVVEDARYRELETARLDLYLCHEQAWPNVPNFYVRTLAAPRGLADEARRRVLEAEPAAVVDASATLEDGVARVQLPWRFRSRAFALFAALALALAALGVHAMLAFAVSQRLRELGIRMALGATPARVARQVLAGAVAPTLVGVLAGAALAFAAGGLASSLLFGVTPADPWSHLAAAALFVGAALGAGFGPALRAARADPIAVMRSE